MATYFIVWVKNTSQWWLPAHLLNSGTYWFQLLHWNIVYSVQYIQGTLGCLFLKLKKRAEKEQAREWKWKSGFHNFSSHSNRMGEISKELRWPEHETVSQGRSPGETIRGYLRILGHSFHWSEGPIKVKAASVNIFSGAWL